MLSDGNFVLGTISAGIFILDKDGKVKYHINQNKGLSNNTALSIFEDFDKISIYKFQFWLFIKPYKIKIVDIKINPIISYPQAKAFKDKFDFPFTATSLSFTASGNAEVKFDNKKTDPEITVLGADENFIPNNGFDLESGRNFNSFDVDNNNYVCIVGANFKDGLFEGVNPIDKTISVRGAKFKVIGLLKEKGATFGNNQDLRIIIPIQIGRSIFSQPNINYDIVRILIQHLPSLIIETKNIYRLCSWDYKTEITLALMLLKYNPVQLRSNNDKIEISVFNCKIKALNKETYVITKILQHNGIKIDTHTLYRTNKYMCGFD